MSNTQDTEFGFDKKLIVLVVKANGKVQLLAPFVFVKRRRVVKGIRVEYSCVQFVAQLCERQFRLINDVLVAPGGEHLWTLALRCLRDAIKFDVLHLDHVPSSSFLLKLPELNQFHSAIASIANLSNFRMHEEFERKVYSKSSRQNWRTAHNRARRDNVKLFTTVCKLDEHTADTIRDLSKIKLLGERFQTDGYLSILLAPPQMNRAVVSQVFVNDKPVSYVYTIADHKKAWILDSFWNPVYKKYELGTLLRTALISYAFDAGIDTLGLGLWSTLHETKFATQSITGFKLLARGNTLKSELVFNMASRFFAPRKVDRNQLL